jgi:hypothetical protein
MYWSSEDVLLWMSCLVMNGEESGLSVFSVGGATVRLSPARPRV